MISQNIIVLFIASITLSAVNGRPKCEMTDKTADECGQKIMFIGEDNTNIPHSDEEMVKRCHEINEGFQCLKKYSKSCIDPLASQVMRIVLKNGDQMEKKYCKEEKGRKELLMAFNCVEHSEEHMNALHLCMEKFIVQMENLKAVEGDHRIGALCCSYQMLDQCTKDKVSKMCSDKTKVDFISKFMNEMSGEVIESSCGKYDSPAHCDSGMDPKAWQIMKDLVASDDLKEIRAKRINKSPFSAMKTVMHHILDE